MQTALFHCVINSIGSNVPVRGVTPAEYVCLRANHKNNAGKHIIERGSFRITGAKQIVLEKDADGKPTKLGPFPDIIEYTRLVNRYGRRLLEKLYPGENPKLPLTFTEVGVGDDGLLLVKAQEKVEIVGAGGKIEEVVIPSGTSYAAPRTDSVVTDATNPANMAFIEDKSGETDKFA